VDVHKNAKLTPRGRQQLVDYVVEQGASYREAARAFGVDTKTVCRWVQRYLGQGFEGLCDRSSRPHRPRAQTSRAVRRRVTRLRRQDRLLMDDIADQEGLSRATVGRILARAGLSRLSDLDPKPPVQRYEHTHPGSMIHLDIKKLGRFERPGHRVTGNRRQDSPGAGWEYAHVAIDDYSRVSWIGLWPDETAASACRALVQALRYYRWLGVRVECVFTDNGSCYLSRRFARLCRRLGIKHRRTRPYTPRTNGKAERLIQTALREWAYGYRYNTRDERARQLPIWLHHYNWHRRHGSLNRQTPITRVGLSEDNLMRLHS